MVSPVHTHSIIILDVQVAMMSPVHTHSIIILDVQVAMMSPVHTHSIIILDGDIAVTRLVSDTDIHCSRNHTASLDGSHRIMTAVYSKHYKMQEKKHEVAAMCEKTETFLQHFIEGYLHEK